MVGVLRRSSVVLLLALGACLPIPHRANVTPLVHGGIHSDGAPAADVALRVAVGDEDDACGGEFREVQTGSRGEFAVAPIRSFRWFLFPMAHRYFTWNLCVNAPEGWANVHTSHGYTLVDTGPWWFSEVTCTTERGELLLLRCVEQRDTEPNDQKANDILRRRE